MALKILIVIWPLEALDGAIRFALLAYLLPPPRLLFWQDKWEQQKEDLMENYCFDENSVGKSVNKLIVSKRKFFWQKAENYDSKKC